MKIAIDFDGVLSHTMKRWVEVFNLHYKMRYPDYFDGRDLTLREIDRWAFFEQWGQLLDEAFEIFDKCWSGWEKLEPLESDISQKTKMLSNLSHFELDVVTAVHEQWRVPITNYLAKHGIIYRNLIFSTEKEKLDYDVFIDDSPKNVVKMFEAGKVVLMYNQPWNRDVEPTYKEKINSYTRKDDSAYLTKVYNLYHAIDCIRNLRNCGRLE